MSKPDTKLDTSAKSGRKADAGSTKPTKPTRAAAGTTKPVKAAKQPRTTPVRIRAERAQRRGLAPRHATGGGDPHRSPGQPRS